MSGALMKDFLRIGKVVDTNSAHRSCRVFFEDQRIVSGWLRVLQHIGAGVVCTNDSGSVGVWMPQINSQVLCIYMPIPDGDGYVLGGL